MHCLLNPETSPASRIPSESGQASTMVTQKLTLSFTSGLHGEGMFVFAPQDFSFSCGYVFSTSSDVVSMNRRIPVE